MSGRSLNVVLAGCMLVVTVTYVYYSRKADREYRSTMDSIEDIKDGLYKRTPSPLIEQPPLWTDEG